MNWEKELNIIRGKNLVGKASKEDIFKIFEYLDLLEMKLDNYDYGDLFGTQGWRYAFGVGED